MAHQVELAPLRITRLAIVQMLVDDHYFAASSTCRRRRSASSRAVSSFFVTGSIVVWRVGSGVRVALSLSAVSRLVQPLVQPIKTDVVNRAGIHAFMEVVETRSTVLHDKRPHRYAVIADS